MRVKFVPSLLLSTSKFCSSDGPDEWSIQLTYISPGLKDNVNRLVGASGGEVTKLAAGLSAATIGAFSSATCALSRSSAMPIGNPW